MFGPESIRGWQELKTTTTHVSRPALWPLSCLRPTHQQSGLVLWDPLVNTDVVPACKPLMSNRENKKATYKAIWILDAWKSLQKLKWLAVSGWYSESIAILSLVVGLSTVVGKGEGGGGGGGGGGGEEKAGNWLVHSDLALSPSKQGPLGLMATGIPKDAVCAYVHTYISALKHTDYILIWQAELRTMVGKKAPIARRDF